MCCRAMSLRPHRDLSRYFDAKTKSPDFIQEELTPGHLVTTVRQLAPHGRVLSRMVWGFETYNNILYNARSEDIKPRFKDAFLHRRCIVPVCSFVEGKASFLPANEPFFNMAGIWEKPHDELRVTVLTIAAQGVVKDYHHRMPVLLAKESLNWWLTHWITDLASMRDEIPSHQYDSRLIQLAA